MSTAIGQDPGTEAAPISPEKREALYPEVIAGGYTRDDGVVSFYTRVQALLEGRSDAVVVDFGAGRGAPAEDPAPIRRRLQDLRGPGRQVIGVDVDPAVLDNPLVDSARVVGAADPLPFDDGSVDLVVSRSTWEHIEDPAHVAAELGRIVKPGGWICAVTPNRWGYIAIGASMVPNALHVRVLRRLQPHKAAEDTFPTRYRMNTRRDLQRLFPPDRFQLAAFTFDAEPYLYAGGSTLALMALRALHHLPAPMRSLWQVFITKDR